MQTIEFRGEGRERLEVIILRYERQALSGDYFDDNWVAVEVSVDCGSFRGKFHATFQTAEIESFYDKLVTLQDSLRGRVEFHTIEDQLSLVLNGDGRGHIELEGEALDQPGIGNRLSFKMSMDQTQLSAALHSLKATLDAFPVRT